jgi:hypothetical protein
VSKSVIQSYPNADIQIGIVWIKMNVKDTRQAAQDISEKFTDPRITQFYDPNQKSGKIFAKNLPVKADIAWDIYLFYKKNKVWDNNLSEPFDWMHQMGDTDSDSKHLRCGDDLVNGLYDSMTSIQKYT